MVARFHTSKYAACVALAAALAIAAARGADAKPRQYTFSGACNGIPHWVSLLYDRKANAISNIVVRASCPAGEPQAYRIYREGIIPVTMGGNFADVIKRSGIDYVISGRIVSRSKATLRHKGPPKALICPADGGLKARVCERFTLKGK